MPDIQVKEYKMIINEESKHAMWDMIYDLDNHFPDDALNDEYYEWFYNRYIIPILKTQGITDPLYTEKT